MKRIPSFNGERQTYSCINLTFLLYFGVNMRVPQLLLGLVLLPAYSAAIDIIAITNDTPQCAVRLLLLL